MNRRTSLLAAWAGGALFVSLGYLIWRNDTHLEPSGVILSGISKQELAKEAPSTRRSKMIRDKPADLPPPPEVLEGALPPSIAKWVSDWEAHELAGRGATDDEMHDLHEMLLTQYVDPITLCGLLRTIDFMDGHEASEHINRIVVDQTTRNLNNLSPQNASAAPLIAAMWPLHVLFNAEQSLDLDRTVIESLRKWEVPGSPHSQMVETEYGELLYESGSYDEAVLVYENLEKMRASVTQPSEGINRPLDWNIGLCLQDAGKFAEAAQRFEAAAKQQAPFARTAALSVPVMLYKAGQRQEAIDKFKEVSANYHLSPAEIDKLAQVMQGN